MTILGAASKPGRPRLDIHLDFYERFATVLPRLNRGEISQGQAARELEISVRSFKRYSESIRASSEYPTTPLGPTGDGYQNDQHDQVWDDDDIGEV